MLRNATAFVSGFPCSMILSPRDFALLQLATKSGTVATPFDSAVCPESATTMDARVLFVLRVDHPNKRVDTNRTEISSTCI